MPSFPPDGFGRIDLPLEKLIPCGKQTLQLQHYQRLKANLWAVGEIVPLVVYAHEDGSQTLDGNSRYRILLEMGVDTVPFIHPKRS
jgi:ParB-like chromosome segregation protein Spo0J